MQKYELELNVFSVWENWTWQVCKLMKSLFSNSERERENSDYNISNHKRDSIPLHINEQVGFSHIPGLSKLSHVCIPSCAMDRELSTLEQRNAHLDTSSRCIYFLATPWDGSTNVLRNKTKAWYGDMSQVLQQTETWDLWVSKDSWQALLILSKTKALQEITGFKRYVPAEGRSVQNNPSLCKSLTNRCSNCSVAVGTRALMQVKQRRILQGRYKQSCQWGHGSDFSPHADHTASSFIHWDGVKKEWNGMDWCSEMNWIWIEWKRN